MLLIDLMNAASKGNSNLFNKLLEKADSDELSKLTPIALNQIWRTAISGNSISEDILRTLLKLGADPCTTSVWHQTYKSLDPSLSCSIQNMSLSQLRTMCNKHGQSCKDANGDYLSKEAMVTQLGGCLGLCFI